MKKIKYVIWQEDKYFISQCLNVDISSFGNTVEEATTNLVEALKLYFEDNKSKDDYVLIKDALIGEIRLNVK